MVHLQGRKKLSWFFQEKHFRYNYEIILATKVILNVGFLLSSFLQLFCDIRWFKVWRLTKPYILKGGRNWNKLEPPETS